MQEPSAGAGVVANEGGIWWTDLTPWEFRLPFPGSLISTFLELHPREPPFSLSVCLEVMPGGAIRGCRSHRQGRGWSRRRRQTSLGGRRRAYLGYKVTSLIRNSVLVGPYSRTMHSALWEP